MEQSRAFPALTVRMQAEVTDLIVSGGRVAGVHASTPEIIGLGVRREHVRSPVA